MVYKETGLPVSREPVQSINQGADFLGVDRRDFRRHINSLDHAIRAPNLDNQLVSLINPTLSKELFSGVYVYHRMICRRSEMELFQMV